MNDGGSVQAERKNYYIYLAPMYLAPKLIV